MNIIPLLGGARGGFSNETFDVHGKKHMAINEISARSILQKSGIPGVNYVINAYTGCVHGCVYNNANAVKNAF